MVRKISVKVADRKWAAAVKERDHWTCQRCGTVYPKKVQGLHAAHIFSRRFKRTRHDPLNGVALCFGCHMWAHSNPLEFHEWAKSHLGKKEYALLQRRARKISK